MDKKTNPFQARVNRAFLKRLKESNNRAHRVVKMMFPPYVALQGRTVLSFCSNDYLGLSLNQEVQASLSRALKNYGLGGGHSPLLCGYSDHHERFSHQLAKWLGMESVLLVHSGFVANHVLVSTCINRSDRVFVDEKAHVSLLQAAFTSGGTLRRFLHQDYRTLAQALAAPSRGDTLVATSGVFSMEGRVASLGLLGALCHKYKASLLVDDAHGIGVLGDTGSGVVGLQGATECVDFITGSFGKAFGLMGGFIAGDKDYLQYIVNHSKHYMYTTSLPVYLVVGLESALKQIINGCAKRAELLNLIRYFIKCAKEAGIRVSGQLSPIQAIRVGSNEKAHMYSERLLEKNLVLGCIRTPSVPKNRALLRLCITLHHNKTHIDELIDGLLAVGLNQNE